MILNFSIQNFGPIKDRQTLSFEADKSTHLEDNYVIHKSGYRILKMALIYGSNASGKSTILQALNFLRELVLQPKEKKTDEFEFQPFLFDPKTPQQNTVLGIEFLHNDVKYLYEVEFFRKAIVREVLYFYNPKRAVVFKRNTDINNQLTEIKFGSKIKIEKNTERNLEANTLWNNTVLGGFLKTNANIKELKETTDWFKNYLYPLVEPRTSLAPFITSKIDRNELSKKDVTTILKKADLNISDIIIQEEEEEIPEEILNLLKNRLNESNGKIKALEEKGKFTSVKIELEHTVNNVKYSLPLKQESQGTRRFYGFAGLLALLIKRPTAIPIDELESSLHPDLLSHFIILFLINTNSSQIIATTHNREILDNKDIFRNDAIWFTDKQEDSSTDLYSLADFDSSVIRNTSNILNAYKSGKLKGTPNLGDIFIDLNL